MAYKSHLVRLVPRYGTLVVSGAEDVCREPPSFNVATSFEQPVIPVGVKGQIAVGGWNTDNEYKDLKVTLADGRTVEADMSQGGHPKRVHGTQRAEH